MKKYTLKEIRDLSKEIAESLDDYRDDIDTSEKEQFEIAIDVLLQTLKDIEQI
jgi:hypothetical protein